MVKNQTKDDASEMIEVGYRQPTYRALHGPLAPRQGRFSPEYEYRKFGVPKAVAEKCRQLDARRDFGVHVSKIGGLDALAELELWGVPYSAVAKPTRGTGTRQCWITTDAVFRFAGDTRPALHT